MNFYDLNAKFVNYELSCMKWVFNWGSLLFLMTKYLVSSVKLYSCFFIVRGRMKFSYHTLWPSTYQITCSIISCIANVDGGFNRKCP